VRAAPLLALLIVAAAAEPAAAQVSATAAPAVNSAQRRAILDALRPTIVRQLRSPVEFVIRRIGVERGWALVVADPQRPGGGAILARHLPDAEERDGLTVYAVMRFQRGRWTVHDHVIGPTDVWYCGMQGPPRSLLGC
jgi:hypothetical protein